jgi:hypothetical protein
VWDDYTLARHPVLLLADSTFRGAPATPVCAAIWRHAKPLERLELPARPPFSTPIYGMINADPVGPRATAMASQLAVAQRPAPDEAVEVLRGRGIARAVVLGVPLEFAGLGRLGEMLADAKADPVLIQADLAVHESFHLHSQFPTWLDQPRSYAWPAWDVQPDRAELRARCYAGSPALSAASRAELDTLVAAYDAVVVDSSRRDLARGLRYARRFIELRAARRTLQDNITVAQAGRRITCGLAEDLMELEEGTTQWLGHATTVRAGLTTTARLRGSYAGTQPEMFYQFGPLQLWVLEGLFGREQLHRMTSSIARSTGPEGPTGGVHAQFARRIRSEP